VVSVSLLDKLVHEHVHLTMQGIGAVAQASDADMSIFHESLRLCPRLQRPNNRIRAPMRLARYRNCPFQALQYNNWFLTTVIGEALLILQSIATSYVPSERAMVELVHAVKLDRNTCTPIAPQCVNELN
jgi:hypothetical protein